MALNPMLGAILVESVSDGHVNAAIPAIANDHVNSPFLWQLRTSSSKEDLQIVEVARSCRDVFVPKVRDCTQLGNRLPDHRHLCAEAVIALNLYMASQRGVS